MLEEQVAERAVHDTAEQVRTTCSLARAERLLGREYHGRFLIELLQNAADAWREDERSTHDRSRLKAVVTEEPALLVANQGAPLDAGVVLSSLGHIGASTKPEGEAIGHKGIGFKSVLELTNRPEVYSGLQSDEDVLAIRFDAHSARVAIRQASPRWDELLAGVDNVDPDDPLAGIPVLRYPSWVDDPPEEIVRLAAQDYDTVVRLPFVSDGPTSTSGWWLAVHDAIEQLDDQIILLLDSFSHLEIDDRPRRESVRIRPEVTSFDGYALTVAVHRNEAPSSRWALYRARTADGEDLSSELAMGVRLAVTSDTVVAAHHGHLGDRARAGDDAHEGIHSAPFHLFFPTRIASGTPFLLHGYFEVDAARTEFYPGSRERNEQLLAELAQLAATGVKDLLHKRPTLACALVNEVATCPEPEDPFARSFRAEILELLDHLAWVPTVGAGGLRLVRPAEVVVLDRLHRPAMAAFPPAYVGSRLGRRPPHPDLTDAALALLRTRQGDEGRDELEELEHLLRPGRIDVWSPGEAVAGLRNLLALVDAMRVVDAERTDATLAGLRGDDEARLMPVVRDEQIVLRPCADPGAGRPGVRSRVLMARIRVTDRPLTPPASLDVDFLPEGALSEADIDRARPLGVRPFTVDSVLDRLSDVDGAEDQVELLIFLWRLLSRERQSSLSIAEAIPRAATFDPAGFFWCQPGRASDIDTGAPRQRRERNLAGVQVPCREGAWRPAGEVVLGADWADWIEHHQVGSEAHRADRVRCLRALESLAPSPTVLLAPPSELAELLGSFHSRATASTPDEETVELQLLAFVLRLGVWQVLPLEAWDNRSQEARPPFPWDGELEQHRSELVQEAEGWAFSNRPGRPHRNPWVAEDYRLGWSLQAAAGHDTEALLTVLHLGAPLYRRAMRARMFCSGCRDSAGAHGARHESGESDPFPSHLAVELWTRPWLPTSREGQAATELRAAHSVWWSPEPLGPSVVNQHPERFLERTDPRLGVTRELRDLVGLCRLEEAPVHRLAGLLRDLRQRLECGLLRHGPDSPGLARQAFVGLHRRIYRRLADLQPELPDAVAAAVVAGGVLCERGNQLVYEPPDHARYDDGTHAAYLRHFPDELPRVVLPRDAETTASRLGVPTLELRFQRRGDEDGQDVTSQLETVYFDHIPELLAILVHHSLGAQTLEPTSSQFEQRARRLQNLRVHQVSRLILDVEVVGTDMQLTLGNETDSGTFLDASDTSSPVLYHDFTQEDWPELLRRRLAPHVAAMVDSPAYEHTFELYFNRATDAEREDFLLSLGVRPEGVDRLRQRIGAASRAAQEQRRTWFAAVLTCLGTPTDPDHVDLDTIEQALTEHGLPQPAAARLVALGGSAHDRRDVSDDGALRTLAAAGVPLAELDKALRRHGDGGLSLRVAVDRFNRWRDQHRWTLTGLFARHDGPAQARERVQTLRAPTAARFDLDPDLARLLEPVADELAKINIRVDAQALADDPESALARAGGYASVDELHVAVWHLADQASYERELRDRAVRWRAALIDIATLSELKPAMTRTSIRTIAHRATERLPATVERPSHLREPLERLLPAHPQLVTELNGQLTDAVVGPLASVDDLTGLLESHGLPVHRLDEVHAARRRPRQDVERLQRRSSELARTGVAPTTPPQLRPPSTGAPARGAANRPGQPRKVRTIKVDPRSEQRKRELGDDAEQWALAAALAPLLAADLVARADAIDQLTGALRASFAGDAVAKLVSHAERARIADDEESFIEYATDFLHVAQISDAFGFDILAWLPRAPGDRPAPVFLEVKSTSGGVFYLSAGEWKLASDLHEAEDGDRYAVLAVARGQQGGAPTRMDLLCDPVGLVYQGQLAREPEGYRITYNTSRG